MDVPAPYFSSQDGDNQQLSGSGALFHTWGSAIIVSGHGGWGRCVRASLRCSIMGATQPCTAATLSLHRLCAAAATATKISENGAVHKFLSFTSCRGESEKCRKRVFPCLHDAHAYRTPAYGRPAGELACACTRSTHRIHNFLQRVATT